MGNEAHWGMGYRGIWGTWAIGAQGVWGTRGMGHIGNRSHGAHGPMDNLDFFAYNFINTEWILTKILLNIDINVFYLNTGRFFHNGCI